MKFQSFQGKNIYIFGGSSGIGFAAARQFANLGANLFLFARNENRLQDAAEEIKKQSNRLSPKVACRSVDVTLPHEVEHQIRSTVTEFGSPDILINCAGRAYPDHFESISYEQFEETMKINLFGIWNTIQSALPHMKQKGGVIVNVSSVAGFIGVFGYTDYAASKFGIIGLSEALRSELKKYNILVSVLCPPDTHTPGFEVENQTKPEETKAISKSGGILEPEDVASALIQGISKGKKRIIPGLDAKMTYLLKRWAPGIVDFVMDRIILRVQKKNT